MLTQLQLNQLQKVLLAQGIAAIMGADCSGVTGAIATNVAMYLMEL